MAQIGLRTSLVVGRKYNLKGETEEAVFISSSAAYYLHTLDKYVNTEPWYPEPVKLKWV